jgi:hypothetical protein
MGGGKTIENHSEGSRMRFHKNRRTKESMSRDFTRLTNHGMEEDNDISMRGYT